MRMEEVPRGISFGFFNSFGKPSEKWKEEKEKVIGGGGGIEEEEGWGGESWWIEI